MMRFIIILKRCYMRLEMQFYNPHPQPLSHGARGDGKRRFEIGSCVSLPLGETEVRDQIERDLISIRTKEGLAAAKASGKQLGRPAGTYTSKLDERKDEIQKYLDKGVSITSLAKILEVSKSTLYYYLKK